MLQTTTDVPAGPVAGRNVAVIGSGYVGLALSASLALLGHHVECTDKSPERIAQLNAGVVPIVEDSLTELIGEMLGAGRLRFGMDNAGAAASADFVFLCLPTPADADGSADVSLVLAVAAEIGPHLRPGVTVITKSTVPVGTASQVRRALARSDVHVAANPEFLAEGSAVRDCLFPDRIVIGAHSEGVARRVADLFGPSGASRIIITDVTSAELIKYASNAYLATRLAYVNSIAELCEATGADVRCVMAGMGSDHRIGNAFLQPGPGWGGSCLPKDTQALVHTAGEFGCSLELVEAAIASNAHHVQRIIGKVAAALGDVRGRRVALLGLTFKAGTSDLRDSPAMAIAEGLRALGASVQAYDPTVHPGAVAGIETHGTVVSACRDAEALVIGTEWPEFATLDLALLRAAMAGRVIIDARNIVDPAAAVRAGFTYTGIGIPIAGDLSAKVAT
ncbi:MAG TPA: UDP-glucose/GDP-mannose dehydrogenase family protein [Streptosporangiaceae bacterium]